MCLRVDAGLLAFAVVAGAVAFFAPCSVAMLPAYVAYAVRPGGETPRALRRDGLVVAGLGAVVFVAGLMPLLLAGVGGPLGLGVRVPTDLSVELLALGALVATAGLARAAGLRPTARGAAFGALALAGLLLVFLALGLPVALFAHGLGAYLPWVAAAIGIALVVVGLAQLTGRTFGLRLPAPRADVGTPRGFFLFGLAYGVASLSCTFPVFLAVVGAGLVSGGFADAMLAFLAYALGKGVVLVGVTVLAVAGGDAAAGRARRLAKYAEKAGAVVLVLAGAYVAWYYGRFAIADL